MIYKYLIPLIIFIPVAVVQLTLVPLLSIESISPDLVLILLVLFTLRNGQLYGTLLGFVFGLLFDLMSGGLLGSAMFAKTLSGFIAGYFYNEGKVNEYTGSLKFVYIVFLIAIVDSSIYSMLALPEIRTNLGSIIFVQGLMPAMYTTIISLSVILFKPLRRVV